MLELLLTDEFKATLDACPQEIKNSSPGTSIAPAWMRKRLSWTLSAFAPCSTWP